MKNASIITNIVLAVAVAVLFVLHFSSKPAPSGNVEAAEGTASDFSGIVYIQIDSLVGQYDMFNDLMSEFENKAQTVQNDLNRRGRAFENDFRDFQQKVQRGLITRSQAESQQQQLALREQELQNFAQQKQMEMSEEEAVLYRRVFDALDTYLEKLNQEKKYSLIISTSAATNTILKGDKALDITSTVVAAMNDEYIKEKSRR